MWRHHFPGSFVTHLLKRKSDHLPILLCLKGNVAVTKKKRKARLFRFEEMWLRGENCADIIGNAWRMGGDLYSKIAHTSRNLSAWGRNKFGDSMKEMKDCRLKMEQLIKEMQTDEIIAQMRTLDDGMDDLENREEMYWKQRSRQEWLKNGDKNTSFFHAKAKQRMHRNHITSMKDAACHVFKEE